MVQPLPKISAETRAMLIALVGPTASGKTLLAKGLAEKLGGGKIIMISQDQYYKDWAQLPFKKREAINFDHPHAFDFALMQRQLRRLQKGKSVTVPHYSYKSHKRLKTTTRLNPKPWIIVEGLLLLYKKPLRDLFDLKIYLDIEKTTGFYRRVKRDVAERGETVELVCKRYFRDVLPMQERFVEPQKQWADIVISGQLPAEENVDKVMGHIAELREERGGQKYAGIAESV